MKIKDISVCPGTLDSGYDTYSPKCIKNVFNGVRVSHVLKYNSTNKDEKVAEQFIDNRKRISISGVQEKLSFKIDNKELVLTNENDQGTFILKPIPRDLKKVSEVPANEHLTMQIASQVYKIKTAANALVFFSNGEPAYITRRFDVKADDSKWGIEDFATLAGKSSDNGGSNYKYDYSYEELGGLIRKYVPAWRVEIEKYFTQVIFNYLFSNGDAHLKNFSLMESKSGDYLLSPSYDLINTKVHVSDTDFALSKGLFDDNFKSVDYKKNGHPSYRDFIEFGRRIGVVEQRIEGLIQPFTTIQPVVKELIDRSFLSRSVKRGYEIMYNTKRNYLK